MNIAINTGRLHPARSKGSGLNRRATFILGFGGLVGLGAQPRQVQAEPGHTAGATNSQSQLRDLKAVRSEGQVVAIRHDKDKFEIETADRRKTTFATVALRFKIDSGDFGPYAGRPVLVPGGMIGDRATLFFASAADIGTLIKERS
jgi:hypothetical protein